MTKWNRILLIFGWLNVIIIIADSTIIPLKNQEVVIEKKWSISHETSKRLSYVKYFFSANQKNYTISAYLNSRINVNDTLIIQRSVLTNSLQAYYLPKEQVQLKDGIFNYEILGIILLWLNAIGLLIIGIFDRKIKFESGKRNVYVLLAIMSLCLQLMNILFN